MESILATTHNPDELEVILVVDSDDKQSIRFQTDGLHLKHVQVPPGLTMGALNMSGYRAATGKYLLLLNDDVILRTPGWDVLVLAAFRSVPDGIVLVHVNDLVFKDSLCIFPFQTREFCLLAGGICPEGYLRYRIDDHVHNIFDLISLLGQQRRIFLPDVVFEHMNVDATAGDAVQYAPESSIHKVDTRLFDSLLPERKRIALEAMLRIERHLESRHAKWKEKLHLVKDSVSVRQPEHAQWMYSVDLSPESRPRVTIGIVTADMRSDHARKCIELVKASTTGFELILIDNNGDPNFNHSREMNRILSICGTEFLVLMDDDVLVQPGWLEGMLRCMGPGVGVVTPLHRDRRGDLSYAGIVMHPDDTGRHTHILEAPAHPRRIQTLCSAIMLIHMPKCGHIRVDEGYTKYFLDIDYGLRVWEEGFHVVCSPFSEVTHLAGATLEQGSPRSSELFEEHRSRYAEAWTASGRMRRLRQGAWRTVPDIQWMSEKISEGERLIKDGGKQDRVQFMQDAMAHIRSLQYYPALMDHVAELALLALEGRQARMDDPIKGHVAFLLGLTGRQPILYEEGFAGTNIVLQSFTYYALPQNEGAFTRDRMSKNGFGRSFHAESLEALKALILEDRVSGRGPIDAGGSLYSPNGSLLETATSENNSEADQLSAAAPGGASNQTPASSSHPAPLSSDLASDLTGVRFHMADLEHRLASAESNLTAVYQSRTWRTLTGVGSVLEGTVRLLRPRKK